MTAVMLNQQKVPLSLPTPGQALSLPHNFSFQSGLDASKSARSRACAHEVLCPRVGQVSEKGRALLPGLSLPSLLLAGWLRLEGLQVGSARKEPSKDPHLWAHARCSVRVRVFSRKKGTQGKQSGSRGAGRAQARGARPGCEDPVGRF